MSGFTRQPRCTVNGIIPIECSVHASQHQTADTFAAVIALDDPANPGPAYWADTAPIQVTVMATNDVASGSMTLMFQGNVDKVSIDWDRRTVHISGRDNTSQLIESKTNEKWINKQPNDIITDLAGRAGLSVQFSGTASDRAGLKYKDDYNRISELDSYWNVIVRLAKEMSCIAYVKGTQLFIQPWDFSGGGDFAVTYVPPTASSAAQGNVLKLTTERDLVLAQTVTVEHNTWQQKEGKAVSSVWTVPGTAGVLKHGLKAANLTKRQQDAVAKGRADEITSHERTVTIVTYGDVTLQAGMMVTLSGTGTGFDMSYVISDIEHHWSWGQGYIMTVNVRNKSKGRAATQTK
jgi:phage protein D